MQTSASTVGIGAVLIQDNKPVGYASRSLTTSETNYAPIQLECLAIVFGLNKFVQYVFVHPDVKVYSDRQPTEVILKKSLLKAPKPGMALLVGKH